MNASGLRIVRLARFAKTLLAVRTRDSVRSDRV